MIGFLSGVGVNIIAGQVPDLTGAPADGSVAVQKAWNVVIHPAGIDGASVLVGVAAFVIIILLGRTPIAAFGAVFALAVPTIVAVLAGADIAQVKDQGDIPRGIPLPAWPPLSAFSWSLLAGALAVAAIVLVPVGVYLLRPVDAGDPGGVLRHRRRGRHAHAPVAPRDFPARPIGIRQLWGNKVLSIEREPARSTPGEKPTPALADVGVRQPASARHGHRVQVVALKVGGSSPLGHPKVTLFQSCR